MYFRYRHRTLAITLTCCAFALTASTSASLGITLYVATGGDDHWSGELPTPNAARTDGPLASPNGARDAIRRIRSQRDASVSPITVLLGEGRFYLTEPLVFTPIDSGTQQAPIVFAANTGTRPMISGGTVVRDWKVGSDGIWTTNIPEVASGKWQFRQLFVNGQRRRCARSPNDGYYRMRRNSNAAKGNNSFLFSQNDIKNWSDVREARIVAFHSWETSRNRVATVDESSEVATLVGAPRWKFGFWEPEQRYWVENFHDALDMPGEWYLDQKSGTLSYFPMPGENPKSAEIVAPRLTRLVELRGDPTALQFVEHVAFRGIAFSHEDWNFEPQGRSDAQASISTPAAIMADGARNCVIENCDISHVGDYAIWFRRGCRECRIVSNSIHDVGVGGVRIGEATAATDEASESRNIEVHNNHIYDGGHIYAGGVGIWIAQSSQNVVSHNDIHDFFYSGISIGWNWDDAPNRTHHNTIEYNHIHHVLKGTLSDGAAIYTLGTSPGSIIRNNVLHDIWAYETPRVGWGIYLDGTTNGYLVENNLVYRTSSGGIMFRNGAHGLTIRNNIFADSKYEAIWPSWEAEPSSFRCNIIYMTQGNLLATESQTLLKHRVAAKGSLGDWRGNLYWHKQGADKVRFGDEDFNRWQANGLDQMSMVADPEFLDAANFDFRLSPTSPAFKLGFQPFDVAQAGLIQPSDSSSDVVHPTRVSR